MNINRRISMAACAVPLALCLGCGESSDLDKVVVEGSVSYDGQPVKNGEIRFYPIEGTEGPVSGAPIVDGRYRAVAQGGVPVGTQLVCIEAYDTSQGAGNADMTSGRATARINYLPPKYHRESELVLEVTGDAKTMVKDFQLAE